MIFEIVPARNKIKIDADNFLNSAKLCHSNLSLFLLDNYDILYNNIFEIQMSNIGFISFVFDNDISKELLYWLMTLDKLIYLEIQKNIHINNLMIEKYNDIYIYRHVKTFHQNCENIKLHLYNIITKNYNDDYDNCLLIGGECYIFSKLIKSNNYFVYSDFESIILDTKMNNINAITYLVDYKTCNIENVKYDICILNVSKKGLGNELSNKINNIVSKKILYISCNEKSFVNDAKRLTNYNFIQKWMFKSETFCVSLNLFEIK